MKSSKANTWEALGQKTCVSLQPCLPKLPRHLARLHDSEHSKPGGRQSGGGGAPAAQSTHPPIKAAGPQGLRRICWETTEDEERPSGRKSPSPHARLSSYISRQRPLDTFSYMHMQFISCSKRECTLDSAGGRWETLAWLSGPLHVLLWTRCSLVPGNTEGALKSVCCARL